MRPVLDLHTAADLKKFRHVADQTSALVRQFKGSLSAEHGVGIARTEYMREQLGDELLGVMREIKRTFDPKNIFNPGKIFACSHGAVSPCPEHDERRDPPSHRSGAAGTARRLQSHKIDNHLRENFTRPLELPFQPVLAFAFKDQSFIGNLEQCNGCGGCLKQSGIMCPTFIATHDEVMSTRGRANIIRAALQHGVGVRGHVRAFKSGDMSPHSKDPLKSAELDAALSNCLSCKGCTPECPSNVNLALVKSGNASRSMAPRRPAAARANSKQCRFVRQTRLPHADAGESSSRFEGRAHRHGENNWDLRADARCRIMRRTIRQVVCKTL